MFYIVTENEVFMSRSEKIYIAPPQAFAWYLRIVPISILSQRYWRGKDTRFIILSDTRLNILARCICKHTLANNEEAMQRLSKELTAYTSSLSKELDSIVWSFLTQTEKFPTMLDKLEEANEEEWSITLRSDLHDLADIYAQKLVDEINLWDYQQLPEQERQQTIESQMEQAKNRILVSNAQMLHDDAAIYRPTVHATLN